MKTKNKALLISTLGLLSALTVFLCTSVVVPAIAAPVIVDDSTYFIGVDANGQEYKCYSVTDEEGHPKAGVAIAWAGTPTSTPDTLNVLSTVSHAGDTYNVIAIARGGFRYCDFKYINLPTTIEDIQEEAFAYCEYLKEFNFPYQVTRIAPSTFLDCRRLEAIHYKDNLDNPVFKNEAITEIGDHAFDQCIALKSFYCPENVVAFGESCFQKCSKLVNFYFPSTNSGGTNHITVRPYAFADCSDLIFVYFETNVKEIDNYAFADCNANLTFHYNSSDTPSYSRDGVAQTHWRDRYINNNNTEVISFTKEKDTIKADTTYPCIRYVTSSATVKLDCAQDRSTEVYAIDETEAAADGGEYAIIYKFDTPSETITGCYENDENEGKLIIPNELDGKKVKVIRSNAFANNTNIKEVVFNANLCQICNRAFLKCSNIEKLDFSNCLKLKEVSYEVFQDYSNTNSKLGSLVLPDCLEYVGGYSFANFLICNELHLPSNIKVIDDLAFYRLGYSITNPKIDLELPNTLSDAEAKKANIKHLKKNSFINDKYKYWFAVGRYAFNESRAIRSVTMAGATSAQISNTTDGCSFCSNAFNGATNLIRFTASENLRYFGKDNFKNCPSLREVFLTCTKSQATGSDYPWAINEDDGKFGGTLFFGSCPEVVCYIDGDNAPGVLDTMTLTADAASTQLGTRWNSETRGSYCVDDNLKKEVTGSNNDTDMKNLNRTEVPTYRGVDFSDGIKYWDPKDPDELADAPVLLSDYDGIIAFAKNKQGKYSVARYYIDPSKTNGTDLVDLTNVPSISKGTDLNLIEIGGEAFALSSKITGNNTNLNRAPGLYFILPDTITRIGERAFFRKTEDGNNGNGRFAVRVVTYKKANGNYVSKDNTEITRSQLDTYIASTKTGNDDVRRGFCALSSNITKIGKMAFYNNIFDKVYLGKNISEFGHGAFFSYPNSSQNLRTSITSIEVESGGTSIISMDGNNEAIYYTGSGADHKMIVGTINDTEKAFEFESGTKGVGFLGCANTKFTKITLNSGLQTIYGFGLYGNRKLLEVDGAGLSSLHYISALKNSKGSTPSDGWTDNDYTEIWNTSMENKYSVIDFRDYMYKNRGLEESTMGGFKYCWNLKTLDFTKLTNIRKIGYQTFYYCNCLAECVGTTEYTYKNYDSSTKKLTEVSDGRTNKNENVIDLSGCSYLRSIGQEAFAKCASIKYLHLPDNRGSASQSTLYIGKDPEGIKSPSGAIIDSNVKMNVLIKETADYAHPTFGQGHSAQTHYPTSAFGSGNNIYYYCATRDDIPTSDSTGTKYWTIRNGEYIFFASANVARAYYDNGVVE